MSIFKVKKNNKVYKNFSYSKGNVSLKFVLEIDKKRKINDFFEILEVAQEDVKNEI